MICGCGFVLWCSVGLFYGGCGFVGGAMLALDCVFFFFLVQLLGFVVVAGGPMVGWVYVASSEWVLGQWVAAWVCCLGFFIFIFLVLTVDYGLVVVVVVVSSVCSTAMVVIVVVEQK